MRKPKLTPWFPPLTHPVHVGFYEVNFEPKYARKLYSYWNGKYWHSVDTVMQHNTTKRSRWIYGNPTYNRFTGWRGLAQPHK